MAIGITTTKTSGRLVFELSRGEDTTTRSIDVPYPKTNVESLQSSIDSVNSVFASDNSMNTCIQPATWRDNNVTEEQWTTTRVYYEVVVTSVTPVEPEVTSKLSSERQEFEENAPEEQDRQEG